MKNDKKIVNKKGSKYHSPNPYHKNKDQLMEVAEIINGDIIIDVGKLVSIESSDASHDM